jgi:hypothetical protein
LAVILGWEGGRGLRWSFYVASGRVGLAVIVSWEGERGLGVARWEELVVMVSCEGEKTGVAHWERLAVI